MTAPTVPTAPLPSLDLTKYEGHTPGPWSDDGDARSWSEEYGYARSWVDTPAGRWTQEQPATGNNMARQMIDAKLIADAPQLLAALLTMQRERDEALASVERSVTGMNALSMQSVQLVDENARLREQLAASERTCAELRAHIQLHSGDTISLSNELDEWKARAEAAERTVEGLRAALGERDGLR